MSKHIHQLEQYILKFNDISSWIRSLFTNGILHIDNSIGLELSYMFSGYHYQFPTYRLIPHVYAYDLCTLIINRDLYNMPFSNNDIATYIVFNSYLSEYLCAYYPTNGEYDPLSDKKRFLPLGISYNEIVDNFSYDMLYMMSYLICETSTTNTIRSDEIKATINKKIFSLLNKLDIDNPLLFAKMLINNKSKFIDCCTLTIVNGYPSLLVSFFNKSFIKKSSTINYKFFDKINTIFNKAISNKLSFEMYMR